MKLGFVSQKSGKSVEEFLRVVGDRGLGADGLELSKFRYECGFGDADRLNLSEKLIDGYDVIYVRDFGKYSSELAVLLDYCKQRNILVLDRGLYWTKSKWEAKTYAAQKLVENNISQPKSYFIRGQVSSEMKFDFGYPMVLKPANGNKGRGVRKIKTMEDLEAVTADPDKLWIVQEFIESEGDYRVMVLGDEVLGVMWRKPGEAGKFRSLVSKGGTRVTAEIPEEVIRTSVMAANVCGWDLAGVDVIRDENNGKWYVIEVNRDPSFKNFSAATGVNVASKMIDYMISGVVKGNNE